jgi:hypothetical protein
MAANPRKRKPRFRHLRFKVSVQQYREILRYCQVLGLTPNKMIKKALREFMQRNAHLIPADPEPVGKNQLKLFNLDARPVQLSILDGLEDEKTAH